MQVAGEISDCHFHFNALANPGCYVIALIDKKDLVSHCFITFESIVLDVSLLVAFHLLRRWDIFMSWWADMALQNETYITLRRLDKAHEKQRRSMKSKEWCYVLL